MSFIVPKFSAVGLPPDYIFVANENGEIDAKLREWAVEAGKWAAETYLPQDPAKRNAFLVDLETSLTNTFKLEKTKEGKYD